MAAVDCEELPQTPLTVEVNAKIMDQPFMFISPFFRFNSEGSADLARQQLRSTVQTNFILAGKAISGPGKSCKALWRDALLACDTQPVCIVPGPLHSVGNQRRQVAVRRERASFVSYPSSLAQGA